MRSAEDRPVWHLSSKPSRIEEEPARMTIMADNFAGAQQGKGWAMAGQLVLHFPAATLITSATKTPGADN